MAGGGCRVLGGYDALADALRGPSGPAAVMTGDSGRALAAQLRRDLGVCTDNCSADQLPFADAVAADNHVKGQGEWAFGHAAACSLLLRRLVPEAQLVLVRVQPCCHVHIGRDDPPRSARRWARLGVAAEALSRALNGSRSNTQG